MRVATEDTIQDDTEANPDHPTAERVDARPDVDTHKLEQMSEQARAWVSEHPVAALGIALAAGFAVGRVVRR